MTKNEIIKEILTSSDKQKCYKMISDYAYIPEVSIAAKQRFGNFSLNNIPLEALKNKNVRRAIIETFSIEDGKAYTYGRKYRRFDNRKDIIESCEEKEAAASIIEQLIEDNSSLANINFTLNSSLVKNNIPISYPEQSAKNALTRYLFSTTRYAYYDAKKLYFENLNDDSIKAQLQHAAAKHYKVISQRTEKDLQVVSIIDNLDDINVEQQTEFYKVKKYTK